MIKFDLKEGKDSGKLNLKEEKGENINDRKRGKLYLKKRKD